MTIERRKDHRTFIWNRPSGRPLAFGIRPIKYTRPPARQAPTMGVPSRSAQSSSPKRHKAIYAPENGSEGEEIWIEEKADQNFQSIATDWEVIYSSLTRSGSGFTPVVNDRGEVTGYYGEVPSKLLLFDPDGTSFPETSHKVEESLQQYRMYIGTTAFYHSKSYREYPSQTLRFAVYTNIDGEVTWVAPLAQGHNGEAISMGAITFGWWSLAKSATRLLTTQIGRAGVRTLTRVAPKKSFDRKVHVGSSETGGKPAHFNPRGLRENCVGSVAACEKTRITKDIWTEQDIARKFGETDKMMSGKTLDLAAAREYIEVAIGTRLSRQAYDLGVGRLTPGHYVIFGGNSTNTLRHVVRATVHQDGRLVIYDPSTAQRQITWFQFKGKYGPGTRAYRVED